MDNQKQRRAKAETEIIELMDLLENSKNGYNAQRYRDEFKKMSDAEFTRFLREIYERDDRNLYFEINESTETGSPKLEYIINVAKKLDIPLREYIYFPHKNPDDPGNPMITKTPVLKIYVTARRLQQFLDKKNSASSNTDVVNHMTGQLTGESKSASINDTQTASLAATSEFNTLKEFLGPRADDPVSKAQMISAIEKDGKVSLADVDIDIRNKQSLRMFEVYLRGSGYRSNIFSEYEKEKTE